jgi:hypothetical protein
VRETLLDDQSEHGARAHIYTVGSEPALRVLAHTERVPSIRPLKEAFRMTETVHEDNATPTASDEDVKRMDADTPHAQPGDAVDEQGVGQNPTDSADTDQNDDVKSGGTPVHPAPTEDSPHS